MPTLGTKRKLGGRGSVYRDKVRVAKFNVLISPLTADYATSGRLLRERLPVYKKAAHIAAGDEMARKGHELQGQFERRIKHNLAKLKSKNIDPGPLVSGIVSREFTELEKEHLRTAMHNITDHLRASYAHYSAARLSRKTAMNRFLNQSSSPSESFRII